MRDRRLRPPELDMRQKFLIESDPRLRACAVSLLFFLLIFSLSLEYLIAVPGPSPAASRHCLTAHERRLDARSSDMNLAAAGSKTSRRNNELYRTNLLRDACRARLRIIGNDTTYRGEHAACQHGMPVLLISPAFCLPRLFSRHPPLQERW